MDLHDMIRDIGDRALQASREMVCLSSRKKCAILHGIADELDRQRDQIKAANERDLEEARHNNLADAMLDRLTLTDSRLDALVESVREVASLKDPVGKLMTRIKRPNGLVIEKRRVPLGVVAIIFESRPNVTVDAAVLCVKTSNAVILRGGKEAFHSNQALVQALRAGGVAAGMPKDAVQLIGTTDREAVRELVRMDDRVDVVIPRGGESLIRAVVEHARVPVLKHYKGVCHILVDDAADCDQAIAIVENAKCQRPGVCNAVETVLVHQDVAPRFIPKLAEMALRRHVELRGCPVACALLPVCLPATEQAWFAEYLSLILAVRVVADLAEGIDHINTYGSHHSDAIVTENTSHAKKFLKLVDSAAVYVNASTRFTDGGEFGMGAEMGISTDKLHARGPMGLVELTTYKYLVKGQGQIR